MVHDTRVTPVTYSWWKWQKDTLSIMVKPRSYTFSQESAFSTWTIISQILVWSVVATASALIYRWIHPLQLITGPIGKSAFTINSTRVQRLSLETVLSLLVLIPIIYVADMGIIFALSRRGGGKGSFRAQCSAMLLFLVPLGITNSLIQFIPILGALAAIAFFTYGLYLQVKVIKEIHLLPTDKSIGIMLIPLVVLLTFGCVLAVPLGSLLIASLR